MKQIGIYKQSRYAAGRGVDIHSRIGRNKKDPDCVRCQDQQYRQRGGSFHGLSDIPKALIHLDQRIMGGKYTKIERRWSDYSIGNWVFEIEMSFAQIKQKEKCVMKNMQGFYVRGSRNSVRMSANKPRHWRRRRKSSSNAVRSVFASMNCWKDTIRRRD